MLIYTLWHEGDPGDVPWLADAVDEYTVDNNGEFPPDYANKRVDAMHRELIIDVPLTAVQALFDSPTVKARVVVAKEPK
jgi:hypothetical protein